MGVSRAILIPTLSVSKRALIPSDGAARGFDVPYRADDVKIGAADFGQRPLSCTRDAQPNKQSTGEAERLAGPRRATRNDGVTAVEF
jgi:hypothetical protein